VAGLGGEGRRRGLSDTALVTGAQGFAGAWLSKALLEGGTKVVGYDRGRSEGSVLALLGLEVEVEVVAGDLVDGEAIAGALGGIDSVFHLAAQTIVGEANESPLPTFESNVRGTWTLLEACRQAGVGAVVVASSDKAYGPSDELPYTEETPLRATFPYDASKAAADLLSRSYWHTYELPVAVTRFANLYGGGDLNFSRLVPETVTAVLDGRSPVIRSDGSPERDFLYVEDAARAYLAIAAALREGKAGGEAFNAGGGEPHSVREVVELICELGGGAVEPDFQGSGTPAGEIDRQWLDSSKLTGATGWKPEVDLREGLSRALEWYRAHPDTRPPS
jgi:CDP-glucose 4,6-dehydratase